MTPMDGDHDRLRRQVRGWLAEGRLPRPSAELWVGPGSGHACAICAAVVHPSQIEYEVPNGDRWLSVHLTCFSLWKAEAAALVAVPTDAAEPSRLGSLLFGEHHRPCESETDWTARLRDISQGDRLALHALYHRMHWPVLTLIDRVTRDRELAAELAAGVFHDVWRQASVHDSSASSVAGWIMSLARSAAADRSPQRERVTPAASPGPDLLPASAAAAEPEWDYAAPGVFYSVLARDTENERVSLVVRLAPGAAYPAHTHAGVEELYLLEGQLFIDGRALSPGDYNRAEAGSGDQHVWSETGCSCVLLTSTLDVLR
jgi:anti-sigma factor ChrR (cupin superfamily)